MLGIKPEPSHIEVLKRIYGKKVHTAPVVSADKKKDTYIRLFHHIVNIIPEYKPRKINFDFEAAAISALKEEVSFRGN